MIKNRMLEKYKIRGKYYHIEVDGTGLATSRKKYNKNCLVKNKIDKNGNEYQEYSTYMLKAKLVIGEMVFSIGSEFVENEGFNVQKKGTFDIGHLYSKNSTAIKIHYLLIQIAHIIRQMLEKGLKSIKELNLKLIEISQNIKEKLISITITNLEVHRKVQLRFE